MAEITVLGAGSWGTTFAKVMADSGREVTLWARRGSVSEAIERHRENAEYLPGVRLPDTLRSTSDPRVALDGAHTVVLAVPSQSLRHNLAAWSSLLPPDATLVSLAKGVELGTLKRMSEVVVDITGVDEDRVAVVSGPNLALEIAQEQPTASVIACRDHDRAVALQELCTNSYFRPYTITDVIGCEIGGACKNVIALSCGMATGLGFGANTLATLITRGLAETARLGAALGADPLTFSGLAGLGDLVATCSSPLSRNRTFGARLGKGETVAQAQAAAQGQVAEGVKSCSSIRELAQRHGVEMPITEVVHRVCHDGFDPREMAGELIGRKTKPER
ncbi:glycerol 3-phosphate dehydrogenase (NAD(P)+) [Actinokineospora alba]|uniref:Glycerol-3-phosphate dehydrogenase [NAD(P)+] n=1 Tax=Actinokineospora alba TaxID=504798 RepID=A0A1H0I063_9PSEU|nr:NAD(P)H-dependent glycerol-3-phosphate dehydrogenase [Actinokineospora alba]TDP64665.1 glycerol-3-phosphate dehydrogenase (NAD(P)+) [Actinokineospora alba]SDI84609.1 glycerol-3-phosphate dehydrogenase (NAD(P)+) [Actinokineospora alba]SDO24838.1 glycerol 3-phosphate dehydrogenase (NAD(P)+) [Actinokineospora alba]